MDVVGTERLLGRLKITLSESQNYLLSYLVVTILFQHVKKITIVKCALFIATQNGELGDECKDIWHVQTRDENSGESPGRVARTMNCVTV